MVVPKEYYGKRFILFFKCLFRQPNKEIYFMFCIELSRSSIANGLVVQILQSLKVILDSVANPERTQIWYIFYN